MMYSKINNNTNILYAYKYTGKKKNNANKLNYCTFEGEVYFKHLILMYHLFNHNTHYFKKTLIVVLVIFILHKFMLLLNNIFP